MVSEYSSKSRLQMISSHLNPPARPIHTIPSGSKFTKDYKIYYSTPEGKIGSWFHDVPLSLNKTAKTVNMVVEIPRWSNAKMEITKELPLNPITQDIKKGKLRFVHNIYPFHGYIHNYGAIPQTWEDCTKSHESVGGLKGDNDPLDICDIGSLLPSIGDIIEIKVLGALALIDDGELDWKIIGINVNDLNSGKYNDIKDLNLDLLNDTRNWFKNYKIPDGKPENQFAFNGEYLSSEEAIKVIEETNKSWKSLINGEIKGGKLPLIDNINNKKSVGYKESFEIKLKSQAPDSQVSDSVNEVYYLEK